MRVCLIGPAPPLRGGIAKHTAGLAATLEERGHDVRVISFRRLYPTSLFPGRTTYDGTTALGEQSLDALDPRTWVRVRASVRSWGADLLIAQWWHPCAAPALTAVLWGARPPVAVVCHNTRPHEWFPSWRSAVRTVLGTADLALCHSHFVAGQVALLAPGLACEVAPMPLLLTAPERGANRAPRGAPTALCAGLVRGYKGIDLLLEAWSRARLPRDARLVIAGESYLGARTLGPLLERAQLSGSVEWHDRWLEDAELWALMLGADVLVLPYVRASQSGLLPIALRAGVRVIATDAGGLAEGLDTSAGHTVVQAGDSAVLTAAIERALSVDALRQRYPAGAVQRRDSWLGTVEAVERLAMDKGA